LSELKTKTALSERGYKRLSRPIRAAAQRDGIAGSALGFAFGVINLQIAPRRAGYTYTAVPRVPRIYAKLTRRKIKMLCIVIL